MPPNANVLYQGAEGEDCSDDSDCQEDVEDNNRPRLVCGHDDRCRTPCVGGSSCCSQGRRGPIQQTKNPFVKYVFILIQSCV